MKHDPTLKNYIRDTPQFHMGAYLGQANASIIHVTFGVQSDCNFGAQNTLNQPTGDEIIIPVEIFMIHQLIACIASASYVADNASIDDIRKMADIANNSANSYQAKENKAGLFSFRSILSNLSKCCVRFISLLRKK